MGNKIIKKFLGCLYYYKFLEFLFIYCSFNAFVIFLTASYLFRTCTLCDSCLLNAT